MRKEMFQTEMARVWREHREAIDAIFQRSKPLTEPVQVRLEELMGALTSAVGRPVGFYWGPARYTLAERRLAVGYRLTSEDLAQSFETTIVYGPEGAEFDDRRFEYDDADRLLVALTQKVWEAFQPPAVREMEIYPPRKG